MSGWFPQSWDGAIPPNEQTPDNPPNALKPGDYTQPVDTSALYYGLGCDVRIRAPVLNAIISELLAVCEYASVAYQAGRVTNLRTALVRLIQSGGAQVPHGFDPNYPGIPRMMAEIDALKKEVATLRSYIRTLDKAA